MGMKLVSPSLEYKDEFFRMAQDYKKFNEKYYKEAFEENFSYEKYIEKINNYSKGIGLKDWMVPYDSFWMISDSGEICGSSRLRHYLTPNLEREAGHIGYDVPPSKRNLGNGTLLLNLTLEKVKNIGLKEVIITCNKSNIGSRKIIERNKGVFIDELLSDYDGELMKRYLIKIA